MDFDRFYEILNDDDLGGSKLSDEGCATMKGLKIIEKYIPGAGIEGAGHDVIYSVDVDKLIEAGITEEDTEELRALNWMVEEESYMAHFV